MSRAPNKSHQDAGFSLVEALVALAIFAIAGVGLVQLQAYSLRTLSDVETRAVAALVAQNVLVDVAASRAAPALGESQGEVELAGRQWRWRLNVAGASDVRMRHAGVDVFEQDADRPAAHVDGFFAAPEGSAP